MALTLIKGARGKTAGQGRELSVTVRKIIDDVRARGEAALFEYAGRYDGVKPETMRVGRESVQAAYDATPEETVEALRLAHRRIRDFASRQRDCLLELSYKDGEGRLELGHRLLPVESCGCYVPAGRYPLPSSALMSITTAKVAGVARVAATSPPVCGTDIHPAVLVAMDIAGADEIYRAGGAGAIAAFAYGVPAGADGGIRKVDMIAGPGNRFVTEAKRQVSGDVGIDGLAGPSEVLIIADSSAEPRFVAADLLAQAEHDPEARPELVCTDRGVIDRTFNEIERQLAVLPTKETAALSWEANGVVYLAAGLDDAVKLANERAPEHIELQIDPAAERSIAERLTAYGSLFVGHYAPVAFGDFVSGTNHILPTAGSARFSSGLWVGTFMRAAFHQFISKEGCETLASPCASLAGTEGLFGHRDSVMVRLEGTGA
ncbi:MAG: histidinol dehydrogenase [Spirochaetaceae bacterium]|jgi:histidinol dehydrogenase/sulfopropanediol 3-dehydrogenase|nr:histidinol dehydrogenase [Spirochaetaceae bacterium]